jgi:SAM-dependent methyltransferase
LPFADDSFHATVSGLVLNFVPDPAAAVAEMARVTRGGGTVAAYVWDYAAGMGMLRHFWDAARVVDPRAAELDEGQRFALCSPEALGALWRRAGLDPVSVDALDVPTEFAGFDDYWGPFLGGQGPAPGYLMSLPHARRDGIERELRAQLPLQTDGRIVLGARAWAVRGRTPNGGVALTDAD